jgi:hypothetical protein
LRQAYPGRNFNVRGIAAGWTSNPTDRAYFVVGERDVCLASSRTVSMSESPAKITQQVIKDFKECRQFLNPTLFEDMKFVKQVLADEYPGHDFAAVIYTEHADRARMKVIGADLKYVLKITGANQENNVVSVRIAVTESPPEALRAEIIEECNAIVGKVFE